MIDNVSQESVLYFIEDLASDSPAPGGGAAAAITGAMGAALVAMVANLTVGREKYAEFQETAEKVLDSADILRFKLLDCADNDMAAFNGVMEALHLPKGSDEEKAKRSEALQKAYKAAILAPLETISKCLEVMKLASEFKGKSNPNVYTDLVAAATLANAGINTARLNVEVNLPAINDTEYREQISDLLDNIDFERMKFYFIVTDVDDEDDEE